MRQDLLGLVEGPCVDRFHVGVAHPLGWHDPLDLPVYLHHHRQNGRVPVDHFHLAVQRHAVLVPWCDQMHHGLLHVHRLCDRPGERQRAQLRRVWPRCEQLLRRGRCRLAPASCADRHCLRPPPLVQGKGPQGVEGKYQQEHGSSSKCEARRRLHPEFARIRPRHVLDLHWRHRVCALHPPEQGKGLRRLGRSAGVLLCPGRLRSLRVPILLLHLAGVAGHLDALHPDQVRQSGSRLRDRRSAEAAEGGEQRLEADAFR
mmetsp:Transcript_69586/g.201664  ORF Transcript_69586/g.201664 Transcript_69586/m.201664 type:complete len:259 (+) Transcript_69586:598-1374(+)